MLACNAALLGLFAIAAVTTHVNAFASSVDERVLVEYKMTGSHFILFLFSCIPSWQNLLKVIVPSGCVSCWSEAAAGLCVKQEWWRRV